MSTFDELGRVPAGDRRRRTVRLSGDRDSGPRAAWRASGPEAEEGLDLSPGPRSVGRLLDLTIDLFLQHFGKLFVFCVIVWFPVRALQPFFGPHLMASVDQPVMALLLTVVTLFLTGVAQMMLVGMVTVYVYSRLEGRPVALTSTCMYVLKKVFALGIATLIIAFCTMVGTFAFLVGALIVVWLTYLATTAIVVEGLGVFAGLRRSLDLTKGAIFRRESPFWTWFGFAGTIYVLMIFISGLSGAGDQVVVRVFVLETLDLSGFTYDLVLLLVSTLVNSFATIFMAISVTVFYVDRRVRREGLDLFLALEGLAEEPDPVPGA